MLSALPNHLAPKPYSWVSNGQHLVLTLRTPAASFAMKPWQVQGMATIATYGRTFNTTIH
jgi:hypothetical protein